MRINQIIYYGNDGWECATNVGCNPYPFAVPRVGEYVRSSKGKKYVINSVDWELDRGTVILRCTRVS